LKQKRQNEGMKIQAHDFRFLLKPSHDLKYDTVVADPPRTGMTGGVVLFAA
jgi:tRNA/tmRNA/rRNA uracil-C5-methylase (TrmA/RlmC/RlmD family)